LSRAERMLAWGRRDRARTRRRRCTPWSLAAVRGNRDLRTQLRPVRGGGHAGGRLEQNRNRRYSGQAPVASNCWSAAPRPTQADTSERRPPYISLSPSSHSALSAPGCGGPRLLPASPSRYWWPSPACTAACITSPTSLQALSRALSVPYSRTAGIAIELTMPRSQPRFSSALRATRTDLESGPVSGI
jgi:hypothetical protein